MSDEDPRGELRASDQDRDEGAPAAGRGRSRVPAHDAIRDATDRHLPPGTRRP